MKKRILFIVILVVLCILVFPVPRRLKDGGSVEYKSILYKITDVKKINFDSTTGYEEGIVVEVFNKEIFNNVCCDASMNVEDIEGVSIKINDSSLTNTRVTIIIEDINKEKYVYGEEFFIEKNENGSWTRLNPINDDYGFNEMGYLVNDDNKLEMVQDWSKIYGPLKEGKYRLVKNVFDNGYKYFSVEFKI
ncbi:MAG: hypothetical protein E7162_01315 [Firmicutes bacterium]|nr:hypothetical protein [Bacillota bacterium]